MWRLGFQANERRSSRNAAPPQKPFWPSFFFVFAKANELDSRHGRGVAGPVSEPEDAGVSAGPVDECGPDLGKEFADGVVASECGERTAAEAVSRLTRDGMIQKRSRGHPVVYGLAGSP